MAATLSEIAYLSTYPPFTTRVEAAVIQAAINIGAEADDGSQYETLRRALATNVLQRPMSYVDLFNAPVAANPVITNESTDSDLQFTVASVWDAIAGAGQKPTA
jgi:hypothetical protein